MIAGADFSKKNNVCDTIQSGAFQLAAAVTVIDFLLSKASQH